ncbi:guanine nucleotide exchange factor DBS-like isoform X2 [Actinia tenebrosa]|uniref:Guanine nucleotide exchange factor DBS-like isoform X2 n=1 Tax=Actinia tenebrosa TaxID=6105 RepID=A0A6P8HH64_ACTTE|nr:guanine nucleotide exchange factor DBS-like isoform X2 [Actinia tenebrosa]
MANKNQEEEPSQEPKIRAYDIAEILQENYAFLSGGKDHYNNLIVTIPVDSKINIADDNYIKIVFKYLLDLSSRFFDYEECVKQEFTVILDRRKGRWSNVNTTLAKLKNTFPSPISCVFVLKPQGIIQKFMGGSASQEAQATFKIVVLGSVADLQTYIEQDQLSTDLGGKLEYKHEEWIENRSAIERFYCKVEEISKKLDMMRRKFERTEITSSIQEMEFTLESQKELWKDIKEDIISTRMTGVTLLKCIHPSRNKDDENDNAVGPDVKANTTELEGLFKKLNDSDKEFERFFENHEMKFRQGLEISLFELEVGQITGLLFAATSKVSTMVDVGDSRMAAEKLLDELHTFKTTTSRDPISRAKALIEKGKELAEKDSLSKRTVKMRCDELSQSCAELNNKIEMREKQLKNAMDIHDCLQQVSGWCTKGSDLLATQPVEKFQTSEGAEKCLEEIESFLKDRQGISLKKLNQLEKMSKELGNTFLINKVKDSLKRIGQVNEMMTKRENSLKRMVAKRPVQPVTALQVDKGEPKRKSSSPSNAPKSAESKRKMSSASAGEARKVKPSPTPKRPVSIVVSNNSDPPSPVPLAKNYAKAVSIPDLLDAVDGEDTTEIIKKRMQIMMELVATERDYVEDLRCIIRGYIREFEKASDKIPPNLYDKKNIIFGNVEQIYEFHNEEFLKELEKCVDDPLLVGEVFHEKRDDFDMYAVYCKNKPASEALQQDFVNLPIVKEWQNKLGHKLPLSAYLLKPVQRITKYQLLLKEMMKNTRNNRDAYVSLMEALQSMQSVLRHLNDVMHSRGLRGYHGNLAELGKLLLQDSFNVWHVNKRGILPLRGRPRQVFLYEKMVIFSKREEDFSRKDVVCYQYKNSLKLSETGITETVKHAPMKFELWLNNRSEVFILQAVSQEEKEKWVAKLRDVLLSQFDQAKAEQKFKSQELGKWNSTPTLGQENQNNLHSKTLSVTSLDQESGNTYDDDGFDSDEFDSDESPDECTSLGSSVQPLGQLMQHGFKYTALAEYYAIESGEMTVKPGQAIEVLKIGNDGWWYARDIASQQQGWVPASYLEPLVPSQ